MQKRFMFGSVLCALFYFSFLSCTKKQAKNPALAYSDKSLFDSCALSHKFYNDTIYSGAAGPHGPFKLRFNSVAFAALPLNGEFTAGDSWPDGSMLIKDVHEQNQITLYAFMYKRSGTWLWGEYNKDGSVIYSVSKDPSTCLGCHASSGNRDHTLFFDHY